MIILALPARNLRRRVERRVHLAAERCFRRCQALEQIRVRQILGHNQDIDVARCRVAALGHRAEDEGQLDPLREICESGTQHVGQTKGLDHDSSDLVKDRRGSVGLVVRLIANSLRRHDAGGLQALKLTLQRALAGAGKPQQLVVVERAIRLAEEQRKQTLLDAREQALGDRGSSNIHEWDDSPQNGDYQVPTDDLAFITPRNGNSYVQNSVRRLLAYGRGMGMSMATVNGGAGNNHPRRAMRELFAVVDVHNCGGPYWLGTVVATGKKRFSIYDIKQIAVRRAGGLHSGGYIPCVGVQLKSPTTIGLIIPDSYVSEIYGTESSIKSIQNTEDALRNFDFDKLVATAKAIHGCIELPAHYGGLMVDWLEDCDGKRVFALREKGRDGGWEFVDKFLVRLPAREVTVRRALDVAIQRIYGP